jgi:ADP-ribose pyrophosphatase YjhB (NUDIX family)
MSRRVLLDSRRLRVEEHTIKVLAPDDTEKVVEHWLWVDIQEHINVLPSISMKTREKYFAEVPIFHYDPSAESSKSRGGSDTKEHGNGEELFVLFRQRKYGYDGESFAVVGGAVEELETPVDAARREIHEELGLQNCANVVGFGSYRVDVNRGAGVVHPFIARFCEGDDEALVSKRQKATQQVTEDANGHDMELQRIVLMTRASLQRLLVTELSNGIKEVKWSHTIAMSLLYLQSIAPPETRKSP